MPKEEVIARSRVIPFAVVRTSRAPKRVGEAINTARRQNASAQRLLEAFDRVERIAGRAPAATREVLELLQSTQRMSDEERDLLFEGVDALLKRD